MSPQEKLKQALSSGDSFLRHYLEITELTMGTYKHIGYIRFARLIGKEISELYLLVSVAEPNRSLTDLLLQPTGQATAGVAFSARPLQHVPDRAMVPPEAGGVSAPGSLLGTALLQPIDQPTPAHSIRCEQQ